MTPRSAIAAKADSLIGPNWPLAAAGASALMLVGAHAFERLGGLAPCSLCLRQREIYWAALAIALLAAFAVRRWRDERALRVSAAALGLCFLTGAIVAGYHAGVEWKFWPGPAACSGGALPELSAASVLEALGTAQPPAPCDEAAWRMFGLSMAGYNVIISSLLTVLSGLVVLRAERREAYE